MTKVINSIGISILFFIITSFNHIPNDWSSWTTSRCFKGIDFRTRRGDFNNVSNKYEWDVQFRNRYNEDVHFSFTLTPSYIGNTENEDLTDRIDIKANTTHFNKQYYNYSWFLLNESQSPRVFIGKMKFGEDKDFHYANCDN